MQTWFAVDKRGLAKLLERKGKQFVLYELIQNAWDEKTTQVAVTLKRVPRGAELEVEDDNPDGFTDLSHAFTLFAESEKKGNAEQRGRFNLGEKLVLALCDVASIASTKGTVIFTSHGRRESRARRAAGTVFSAKLKLNAAEFAAFDEAAQRLIPPSGIKTTYNGKVLEPRAVLATIRDVSLPTELADSDGVLRPVTRKTFIEIIEPQPNEMAMIYEMGIPVVEHDGKWHINVGQKVPLNMDRDNVTPSYLGRVRALVTEHMAAELSTEDANSAWVRDAVTRHGDTMASETIERLTELRFGDKRVAFDPSDPEANALAVTKGYTVVHGGSLNRAEWDAVKRTGMILPAGQVTPSPKPFHPDGRPLRLEPREKWTPGIERFHDYAQRIAQALLGCSVSVTIANDPGWFFLGAYGKGSLTINVARAGRKWFDGPIGPINEFLIHEFGHHFSPNHLDEAYHDALCKLGGQLSQLALDQPALFK